jgi:hypothetical protein
MKPPAAGYLIPTFERLAAESVPAGGEGAAGD